MLSHKRLNVFVACLLIIAGSISSLAQQAGQEPKTTRPRRVALPDQDKTQKSSDVQPAAVSPAEVKPNPFTLDGYARIESRLQQSIELLLGTPYRYGASGDDYGLDCSGFVWRAYYNAGFDLQRTSAAELYFNLPPASELDKTKFGTLVFFNGLGHVGIVKDENSFYHASSSQGVTLSPFKGYWENRIVGYRVVPLKSDAVD